MKHIPFIIFLNAILVCSLLPHIEAIQVIQMQNAAPAPTFSSEFGRGLGEQLQKMADLSLQQRREQERIQTELDAQLRAQAAAEAAALRRLEIQVAEQEKNNRLLQNILQGYHPSKNSEYSIKILQSSLPLDIKQCIIAMLNEETRLYHKNLEKK